MWPRINIDKLRDKFYLFTPTRITNRRMEIITDWQDDEFCLGGPAAGGLNNLIQTPISDIAEVLLME